MLSGHAVWVSVIQTGTPDTENNQNYKSCIHGKVFFQDLCFLVMQFGSASFKLVPPTLKITKTAPDTENNPNYKSCIHEKVFTFADLCFPVMQIPALTTFGVQFCALQLTVNVLSQLL